MGWSLDKKDTIYGLDNGYDPSILAATVNVSSEDKTCLLYTSFATGGEMLSQFTPFAFLTGGIWSMLAGFVGMKIATSSNARTAQAASESLNKGLRVAFSSGSVMGFTVVGLGMLDISIWFVILRFVAGIDDPLTLGNIMVMNGMGAVSYTHLDVYKRQPLRIVNFLTILLSIF